MIGLDPEKKASKYFRWKEVLWLYSWGRMATDEDGLTIETLETLSYFCENYMDKVRELFGLPLCVHCCYRPPAYNAFIKGAKNSAHQALDKNIAAMDFHVEVLGCDKARSILLPKLEEFGLRMEDIQGDWVHLDNRPVSDNSHRFFKP